ncbi:MAG: RsmE family RNA methyltransferase [Spirochaetaceae bacterium]|jgi:RsmE family RNA methyltransferase|nr:RsmE family RNA methyltransferase [Spirochaetaceae bacterium]
MNIILFKENEISPTCAAALPKRDERVIHLLKTLHKQEGHGFCAGLLGGLTGKGKITRIGADFVDFSLKFDTPPPPKLPLVMAVGFPRPIQLRRLLRDLAAFGVPRICLLMTELGDQSYRETKLLKDGGAEAALIEGIVQARDTIPPAIESFDNLSSFIENLPRNPQILYIACDNVRPHGDFANLLCGNSGGVAQDGATDGAVVLVGSERGWSDTERAMLDSAGFERLSIGRRPLRTETACAAACALTGALVGKD